MDYEPENYEEDYNFNKWYAGYLWACGEHLWIVTEFLKDVAIKSLIDMMTGFRKMRRTIRQRRKEARLMSFLLLLTIVKLASVLKITEVDENKLVIQVSSVCKVRSIKEWFWQYVERS